MNEWKEIDKMNKINYKMNEWKEIDKMHEMKYKNEWNKWNKPNE